MANTLTVQQDVIRAAMHLAETRLSDPTQPPNVQQTWRQLSKACGDATRILQEDSHELATPLGSEHPQEARSIEPERPLPRPTDSLAGLST
jgi:hypothetical protein